ncbi:MAG TPA: alpha/beta fold hydrolase [Vicinamibacteria bacterium]|nr:alpha/beta fold hydrolase [Vicinamibacteria bacterium]
MKARIAGAEIAYDVQGQGPPLLFLHAFPLGLFMWDAAAAELARDHTVVRFDARGFGGSPPGDGPLSMERIADDGVALLDHLGLGQAVVAGCSMGGYAAFALVRRNPGRLRGLVLIDTRAEPDTPEGRSNRALLAEKVLKEGSSAAAESFLPRLLGETTRRDAPDLVAALDARIRANPPRGIANALLGLGARADSRPTLHEIGVPTLVVGGAEDTFTPPADIEALARGIAGARHVILPRSGHLPSVEAPEALNRALRDFLGGPA